MRKKMKKILGFMLSFMIVLGMSMTVYADTILDGDSYTWRDNSTINDNFVQIWQQGVIVDNDITLTIPEGKQLTVMKGINANSKTLTVAGKGSLYVYSGTGGTAFTGNIFVNGANVFISGGYIENGGGNGINGNVTVQSGSLKVEGGGAEMGYDFGIAVNGNVNVSGGYFQAKSGGDGSGGNPNKAVSGTITAINATINVDNVGNLSGGSVITSGSTTDKSLVEITSNHDVTITAGSNMTKTDSSGNASQTNVSGEITDVVYIANNGYYFPTDYSVEAVNGISVTRNSYTQITVSGTPTADTEITLTAPTAKTEPDAPTTVVAVNCTTADNNDGKLTGVTTDMEYKKSDAYSWTDGTGSNITDLTPGTYYVRMKATDTTLASDNQELTIVAYADDFPSVVITKAPIANTLTYNGSAQALVTSGTATGGTMQYALGEDADKAPTNGWSADIPKGTEVDTYYVWYKAVGDEYHLSTDSACITVKIAEDSTVLMTGATIEGLPKSGQTLTANISPVDADGDFTYQWKRDNVAIDGATKGTYTLTDADVGKKITVDVKQIIGGKVVAEKTSAETSTVTAGSEYDDEIIVITGIDIEGAARVGRTLTAVYKPEDASGTITYQWTKDKAEISGATNKTYTLKDEDEGSEISVIVTQTIDGEVVKSITSDDVTIKAEIVAPPKLKAKTTTSITIIGTEGYEYSIDGGSTWQDDTVFEGLEPNMEYSIVCRKKATDTSPAGKVSAGLVVKTNAKDIVTDNEIKDNKEYGDGYIRTETNIDRDVPKNTIVNLDADLAESLMTEDEKKEVRDNGAVCRLYLDVKSKDISNLPEEEKQAISDAAKQLNGDAELGMFLDLSMYLQVGDNSARPISDLNGKKVTITIEIPEELRSPDGKERTFYIVRYHEGKADILAVSGSTSITFETELFSTYSVAYSDSTKAYLVSKQKVFGANYFTEYGKDLSKYKYKFKVDDKSQKKTISATKKMIKAKKAGTAKVALYRKTRKGGSWEKIEEHEFVVEKPEVTKKVTTLKQGDTAEALSFVTNKMVVKPTYFLSSKPEIVEVDFHTGKLKVLKKGKTTITISYGNGYGAAKYKTKLIVK